MSERERVARLREWLDSIVPLQGQMAKEEDTVEAIDLWLDLKWLRENLLALLAEQQEEVGYSLEVAVDQLIYARQGEWSSIFTIDRLKLRELIVQTVLPFLAPQPSVERDHREALGRLQLWIDHLWDEVNHVAPEALGPRVAQEVQMGKRIILAALEADKEEERSPIQVPPHTPGLSYEKQLRDEKVRLGVLPPAALGADHE